MIIQKDIPIPEDAPKNNKYNFHKMEVGDSFDVYYDTIDAQRLRVAATNYGRRNNMKFTTRKLTHDDGHDIIRIWRVA